MQRATFCYPDSFFEPKDFGVSESMRHLIAKAEADEVDLLDDYIEAHIHGVVRVQDDVECVVLDPCYRDTEVEEQAAQLGVPVKWHGGFRLTVNRLRHYPDYRGPQIVALGVQIAHNGVIQPALLGKSNHQGGHDAQAIKKAWHYLARFGYSSQVK
ncbi:Protein of unknown function (DUF3626) [Seminavis robusta]|uniref:Uncharacterized protein n=1 Tax=Seminavis robusta TaxID=568900 RepID=A0A9N8HHI2_9STRA|nr:Protein of unknown function (DUF3626) [Seminavis robusta]|eukprot:Sro564_g167380.1 Protein of unknown function (DUF3626) (156) ;mRNA; f:31934-32401